MPHSKQIEGEGGGLKKGKQLTKTKTLIIGGGKGYHVGVLVLINNSSIFKLDIQVLIH